MTTIDAFSLTTVPILPFFNEKPLCSATAFIWRQNKSLFLITNWHVVAARHAQTGENLLGGCRPNRLELKLIHQAGEFWKQSVDVSIRDDDDNPIWFVHPGHQTRRIDIAAIPLQRDDMGNSAIYPVNEQQNYKGLTIQVGMDVFILGYPFGSAPPALPVWKRGSLASEPELARLTDGYHLVDTASRPGMSGSPVFIRGWTQHPVDSRMIAISDRPLYRFVGVYSGRLAVSRDEAQIGMVWHESYVDEIIDGHIRDN